MEGKNLLCLGNIRLQQAQYSAKNSKIHVVSDLIGKSDMENDI